MHVHRVPGVPRGGRHFLLFILFIGTSGGCDTLPLGDIFNGQPDQTQNAGAILGDVKDSGDNSAFERAQLAEIAPGESITIEGDIDAIDDIDLYSLGALDAGDRITIDVRGHDGFNTVAAIFDGNNDLIDSNDDRSYYNQEIDPYISKVMRRDISNLFVGIAVSSVEHFGASQGRYSSGTYSIIVKREAGGIIQEPRRQLVYLDFEGGTEVQIGQEPRTLMRAFSAEAITGRFAGKTEYIADRVVEHMKRDFAEYDIELRDSRTHDRPFEPHSTLYFGNYNEKFLGLADNVDTYNIYLEQDAIIYTEDIGMFESLQPSVEEAALCIANIGSHELGHLLGLEHSRDTLDCMATAATARQILETDAAFRRAPMQSDVFPVGFQNEPVLLLWNLGANPSASSSRMSVEDLLPSEPGVWRDEAGLLDIPIVPCGKCAHGACD